MHMAERKVTCSFYRYADRLRVTAWELRTEKSPSMMMQLQACQSNLYAYGVPSYQVSLSIETTNTSHKRKAKPTIKR